MKKEFESRPIYIKTFMKTKIKASDNEATDYHHKEILKVGSSYTCLAVILIDFILKKRETITLRCFQKNLKTLKKNKKMIRNITEDQEISTDSDESDEE